MGINVGDIIVDENDIYGDGVNVAARLESIATPGILGLRVWALPARITLPQAPMRF